jgi:hypothetical protein
MPVSFARIRSLAAVLVLGASATFAQAAYTAGQLDFQDLGPDTTGTAVPDGYGGFRWGSSWFAYTNPTDLSNTFLASTSTADTFQRSDGQPFYFDGAVFWSRRGLDAQGTFYYVLYLQGNIVFDGRIRTKDRRIFTGTPKLLVTGYKGLVDRVVMVFKRRDWNHCAMDDFRFRAATAATAAP